VTDIDTDIDENTTYVISNNKPTTNAKPHIDPHSPHARVNDVSSYIHN